MTGFRPAASGDGCLVSYPDGDFVDGGRVIAAAHTIAGSVNLLAHQVHQPVALVENGQPLQLVGRHDAFDAR